MTTLRPVSDSTTAVAQVNDNFKAVAAAGLYGYNAFSTTGLNFGFYGGQFNGVTVADSAVAVTTATTSYVVAHRTTGAVTAATGTTNWNDATNYLRLYSVVAGATTITSFVDYRQAYGGTGGGGGGGAVSSVNGQTGAVLLDLDDIDGVDVSAPIGGQVLTWDATTSTWIAANSTAGGSGAIQDYTWNTTTTTPPGTGTIRGNNATQSSITALYVHFVTGSGVNIKTFLMARVAAGDTLYLQDRDEASKWNLYTVTSAPVDNTTYATIAVTHTAGGTALTGQQIIVSRESPGGGGGGGMTNPMNTVGDLIVGSTAGAPVRYGAGTSGMVLTANGAGVAPTWQTPVTGFTNPMTTTGDIIYATSGSTPGRLGVGANGNVLTLAGGVPTWAAAAGGGGLTNWTESVNTSTPNATIPAVRLLATNAAANVDAVLSPKGVGALQAQTADNTANGGNKRGTNAVDWQTSRSAAANVASGSNSYIAGGFDNRSSQNYSMAWGTTCISSGSASTAGGSNNTASGANSFAIGFGNTASADSATALGNGTTANGLYSTALGRNSHTRGISTIIAYASGNVSSAGDVQSRRLHMYTTTNNATPKSVSAGGAAVSTTNTIVVPTAVTCAFRAMVVASQAASAADSKSWEITGLIRNPSGTVALVGTPTVTVVAQSAGASSWTVAAVANTGLSALTIDVTGAASTSIAWSVLIETVETLN